MSDCARCQHPWASHLLGELFLGCTEAGCGCRRDPGDYNADGCAVCRAPIWRNLVGIGDTVCEVHRCVAQQAMRQRYQDMVVNASAARHAPR
jgi:hypothetical protein